MAYTHLPYMAQEYIPPQVENTLVNMFQWRRTGWSADGRTFFEKAEFPGVFSWSEALALELSRTFTALGGTK